MSKRLQCLLLCAAAFCAAPASAALRIFACEPEWGALAKELGGEKVEVYVATNARQDPHHIEARPSLIARARSADLAICTGAELEAGWMPLVQTQSGNPKIRAGQPGYFEAARHARMLEIPERIDRAQGDIHAAGNPHIQLDPRNVERIAVALSERMARLDGGEAAYYAARSKAFIERWQQAMARWQRQAASLKGASVVVHHKNMTYLLDWLGVQEAGALEPKPGLPPTTAHLSELLSKLQKNPANAVIYAAYNDPRAAQWLAERAKIPAITLPFTVGGSEKAQDLFGLFDDTLLRLQAIAR